MSNVCGGSFTFSWPRSEHNHFVRVHTRHVAKHQSLSFTRVASWFRFWLISTRAIQISHKKGKQTASCFRFYDSKWQIQWFESFIIRLSIDCGGGWWLPYETSETTNYAGWLVGDRQTMTSLNDAKRCQINLILSFKSNDISLLCGVLNENVELDLH